MNFSELESLMSSRGVTSLAEIARALSTTPQAVSNWKSRDQVPHHVVAKLNQSSPPPVDSPLIDDTQSPIYSSPGTHYASPSIYEENTISLSDILLTMAEQLKVIVLVPFITVFLTFTYVQFIQQAQYVSWATVLLPSSGASNLGGLAGIASQFGVAVPTGTQADLSSPSLYPELLRSRKFAEIILSKKFYTEKYKQTLPLLSILTHGKDPPPFSHEKLVDMATKILNDGVLRFEVASRESQFSVISVTLFEPVLTKELTEVVLSELDLLNRHFKSQTVTEKTIFIENRITSVSDDLKLSEQRLMAFNEKNRQIFSPSLQLVQERLMREVEIQKGVYLTLKQQLELAKIEEIQEVSIIQVLDVPVVPLSKSNKNQKLKVLISLIVGIIMGIVIAFSRSYIFRNSDISERKKLRRVKSFTKKKSKDFMMDRRISGIISILMILGLPFYISHRSGNPVFFGMYSTTFLIINIAYVLTMLVSIFVFFYSGRKNKLN